MNPPASNDIMHAPTLHSTSCSIDGCVKKRAVSWTCQIITAAILAQTLFFKFTAAPESVYIFTKLGMEPWGRIGSGVAELVAVVLLLIPRTAVFGALWALGVISGAIGSHLTKLGIVVQNDGGLLFVLAMVVFAASSIVVFLRRGQIPVIGARLEGRAVSA